MKKKRPGRKSQKPPPERGGRIQSPGAGRAPAVRPPNLSLQYKVVELSTVDEGSLERTLNEWTAKGWALEGVQFAMRESSKRPAMAFVFFTREAETPEHDESEARERLIRLADAPSGSALAPRPGPAPALSPRERLAQLAGEGDDDVIGGDDGASEPFEWKDLEPEE
jgi:hypothetical protein